MFKKKKLKLKSQKIIDFLTSVKKKKNTDFARARRKTLVVFRRRFLHSERQKRIFFSFSVNDFLYRRSFLIFKVSTPVMKGP